jgi:hypothetical protein
VGLVDDQDAAGEAEQTQGLVLGGQDAEDGLVDRADADVGEEGLALLRGEPGGTGGAGLVAARVVVVLLSGSDARAGSPARIAAWKPSWSLVAPWARASEGSRFGSRSNRLR